MLNRPYDRNYQGAALMGEPEAWAPYPHPNAPRDPGAEIRESRAAPWRQTYVEERLSAAEYQPAPPRPAYAAPRYAPRQGEPASYGDFHELARAIEDRRYRNRAVQPASPGRERPPEQPRYAAPAEPAGWPGRAPRYEAEPLDARRVPAPERPRPYYEARVPAETGRPTLRRTATWTEAVRAEPAAEAPPPRAETPAPEQRSKQDAEIIAALQLTIQALEARIARLEARPLSRFERAREKAEATSAVIAAALPPEPQPQLSRSERLREAARAKTQEAQAARAHAEPHHQREPSPRRLWA
ncbi:hypothetical protein RDV64_14495 [Acuticoccus sp. MNP-M23]|uniref:hypothetical protein n=1 Tax=Acuticoccus sp. MNP-M23 TaxID=3072793 RepID=UPI002816072B|nr:hypothetical protein [Acuticoccus sp. MNP-M23]WMS41288.1 hypothetical protein RDV64_14495 [Acuticoccus sp. MNP-M23]